MALIHEKLYQSPDLARVGFSDYVTRMISDLFRSYRIDPGAVVPRVRIGKTTLSIEAAIPCGLIINELVSNSLKHAFPAGRKGEVDIEMDATDSDKCRLVVKDDGVGLPPGLDVRNTESLGLQLVHTLVNQIGGSMEIHRDGGTEFSILFEEPHYERRG